MRVLHVSESDGKGGAARAAFRIHRSLVSVENLTGIESRMLVRKVVENDPRISPIASSKASQALDRIARTVAKAEQRLLKTENRILHSTARVPSTALRQILRMKPDAVVLHWLGNRVLSIEQVGELTRSGIPVYWVLHDTWAFCGAEHYPHGDRDRRFVNGYRAKNRPEGESGLDVNRMTWNRKRRHWTQPFHVIAPSRWIAGLASSSALMRDWPVDIVPNPMDIEWWGALTRAEARRQLGIAEERRVIVFGADGGEKDPRKGADLLRAALNRLSQSLSGALRESVEIVTFGGREGVDHVADLKVGSVGRLDDEGLRLFYTAADVAVVPSRIDNLPQTAAEPIVCGTPVVGFRIGGMPDIVTEGVTGSLVEPFSTDAMGDAIYAILSDGDRRAALSRGARESAGRWSATRIGPQFAAIISRATNRNRDL
jgi:glycosyltransferase involved in cell wall biosynthesis